MEQQNQQPIQEKTETKLSVKTNWKYIAIVVFLGLAIGGGILVLILAKPTSTPSVSPLPFLQPSPAPTFLPQGKEIVVQGIIKENHIERAAVDLPAWLEVETDFGIVSITYHFGHSSKYCQNTTAERAGFELKKSDRIEIFGKVEGSEIDVCNSEKYYLKRVEEENISQWQTYRNDDFGFELKYPKYEENQSCKFQEVSNGSFSLGRIDLDVLNSDGLELGVYVDRFINERTKDPYSYLFGPPRNTEINGQQGISIAYRFGGLNRLAEAVFLKKADNIYVISFTAGVFLCNEPEIFQQILSTFRFVE